jgi:predicted RNA binding protein YcfA (HicA-like mRNA interferase family)
VRNRLQREGCAERSGKGPHRVLSKMIRHPLVIVPNHLSDVKTGLLHWTCRAAGWE